MSDPHPYIGLGVWVLGLGLGVGLLYLAWLLLKLLFTVLKAWWGF